MARQRTKGPNRSFSIATALVAIIAVPHCAQLEIDISDDSTADSSMGGTSRDPMDPETSSGGNRVVIVTDDDPTSQGGVGGENITDPVDPPDPSDGTGGGDSTGGPARTPPTALATPVANNVSSTTQPFFSPANQAPTSLNARTFASTSRKTSLTAVPAITLVPPARLVSTGTAAVIPGASSAETLAQILRTTPRIAEVAEQSVAIQLLFASRGLVRNVKTHNVKTATGCASTQTPMTRTVGRAETNARATRNVVLEPAKQVARHPHGIPPLSTIQETVSPTTETFGKQVIGHRARRRAVTSPHLAQASLGAESGLVNQRRNRMYRVNHPSTSRIATTLSSFLLLSVWGCSGGDGSDGDPLAGDNGNDEEGLDAAGGTESGTPSGTSDGSGGSAPASGGVAGTTGGANGASGGTGGTSIDPSTLGRVDFVPIYEMGSAWESNTTARTVVDEVFDDFETNLRTSGTWDATIEVYLTDNNPNNASTGARLGPAEIDGMTVQVVPAWKKIVQNGPDEDGPAQPDGSGADFVIHFNVGPTHESNHGLMRHEMMHGLGAINGIPDITMTPSNMLGGLTPGSSLPASLYDLALVDLNGDPLLGEFNANAGTFLINAFVVEPTYNEWIDGDAGVFLRGIADDGSPLDMFIETFPEGDNAALHLAEPFPLMKSGGDVGHPTWHTIEEPDRAFFRVMRYEIAN